MSSSKKLLQSASGYIDQTSDATDVKTVFNMMQWSGNGQASKTFSDVTYSGFYMYGGYGTSNPTSGAMILKDTYQNNTEGEIFYNAEAGSGYTKSLNLVTQRSEHSNTTTPSTYVTFNNNGYSTTQYQWNGGSSEYQSYMFSKRSGFFTTVNYTGNGQTTQQISHDLEGEVGMMWVKNRNGGASPICVYHRGINDNSTHSPARNAKDYYWKMDDQGARTATGSWGASDTASQWGNTAPTDTHFTVGGTSGTDALNVNNQEYVALIWAHDDSDASIIKNIGYVGDNGEKKITLGFTPQFFLIKRVDGVGDWFVFDKLQGLRNTDHSNNTGTCMFWKLNKGDYQVVGGSIFQARFHADGLTITNNNYGLNSATNGNSYVIMAIAKDNVSPDNSEFPWGATISNNASKRQHYFKAVSRVGTSGNAEQSIDMIPDMWLTKRRPYGDYWLMRDRMSYPNDRANLMASQSNYVNASTFGQASSTFNFFESNREHASFATGGTRVSRGVRVRGSDSAWNQNNVEYLDLYFTHAPSFLNSIMYKGDGSATHYIKHGLKAVPEMVWVIALQQGLYNCVWHKDMAQGIANNHAYQYFIDFGGTNDQRVYNNGVWGGADPTDTTFAVSASSEYQSGVGSINESNHRYIMISMASCAGLSSVGSFTMSGGNPTTVDCGFGSSQARFVMVKCVADFESGKPSVGKGFYVWDHARGINGSGSNDPTFQLNNANYNETGDYADIIDPASGGFTVKDSGAVNVGIYDGFYIYWAIC